MHIRSSYSWLILSLLLFSVSCTPKLFIKESFLKAENVDVREKMATLKNGTFIKLKEIFKVEKVEPEKVVITRVLGSYVLTAEQFKHIWLLKPSGTSEAKYYPLEIPGKPSIEAPKFKHSYKHDCVTLTLGSQPDKRWQIHASGKIAETCTDLPK